MLAKFELLETEKQLLQKRLEKVEEKQSENQDNGFDPMGYFGHVKSSDLLRVAPEKNMEIPNRGVHSGMFADTPFASEELGAVKELKKSKEENYQKSEEEESEISGNDKDLNDTSGAEKELANLMDKARGSGVDDQDYTERNLHDIMM
ncbi:uncharacterized protein [Antedon mediterranea]|uniref:uncharacterized protein isoform X2 n=1 Tax=Antedon mediterranea TaxID=105859 RepID=UPI003AF6308A